MPRLSSVRFVLVFLLSATICPWAQRAHAESPDDWPQWRGPRRDGMSAEKNLLAGWPDGGPRLAWEANGLGVGFSSVAVVGGRIFTMGDLGDAQYVIALNQTDGKQLWKSRLGAAWDDEYGGPRGTPTVDGDRIYAIGTEGDLVCLEAASGRERWRKSLPGDFGGRMMSRWKFSESPLVDGNRLIVTPGGSHAAMVALDKMTGAEIWRALVPALGSKGKDGAAYSSVVVSEGAGVRQYVQLMGRGVVGVEAAGGRFLWGYNKVANDVANITTPVVKGDYVFASTGYRTGAVLLRLKAAGGGVQAGEVYFLDAPTLQNHHGGLILHDGYIYSGTGHNRGYPVCVEMETGKVAWGPISNAGQNSAAVSYADGHLYFRYQNGLMLLVEANPREYRETGSFQIPGVRAPSWSHPVISDGKLYLREQDKLYSYDISGR